MKTYSVTVVCEMTYEVEAEDDAQAELLAVEMADFSDCEAVVIESWEVEK
jgi:hypothetical protein